MGSQQSILKPGDIIGKYQVVRCLGVGGMGEVHEVIHQQLHIPRALKLLRSELASTDPVFAERFLREARIAARIRHKNIISVIDVENDSASGFFYIVMEFVNGKSVQDILRNGPLSEDQAVHIISEVVNGLTAASEFGLVHRDIKPSNIMISEDGEVKLADLGIAKATDDDVSATLTMENTVIGTPAYASPEQCSDAHDVDVRADIYSLGATLYEMVTGQIPFTGANTFDTIAHVLKDDPIPPILLSETISKDLDNLILNMMAKKREMRPQNLNELQRLLKPFIPSNANIPPELKNLIHERVEREVQARTSTVLTAYRKRQKNERIMFLAAVIALLIAICVFYVYRNNRFRQEIQQRTAQIDQLKAEKKELDTQIFALENQLKRQKKIHLDYSGEMEEKIRQLNEQINRLKAQDQETGEFHQEKPVKQEKTPIPLPDTAKLQPRPAPAPPESQKNTTGENRDRIIRTEPQEHIRKPEEKGSSIQFVFLDRTQISQKANLAWRKIRRLQHTPQFRNLRIEILKAGVQLDANKLGKKLNNAGLTFEDLAFLPGPILPNILDMLIRYNPASEKWDTRKIHVFLSKCVEQGYRFHFHSPTVFTGKSNLKQQRNHLDILEFLLGHPEEIIFIRGMSDPDRFFNNLLNVVADYPDFPDWLERITNQRLITPDVYKNLADCLFILFHANTAITEKQLHCLELLNKRGFNYHFLNKGDRNLIKAVADGDLEAAERAVREEGAEPQKRYPVCGNVLFIACKKSKSLNPDIVRMLLSAGTPINIPNHSGKTPLAMSIEKKDPVLTRLLLDNKASLNDFSALEAACHTNNILMADRLLKNGTPPSRQTTVYFTKKGEVKEYGNELLFLAMKNKSSLIAVMLIDKGVLLTQRREGKTPLEFAEDARLKSVSFRIRQALASKKGYR